MSAVEYRRARAQDLGAVNAIFREAQTAGDADPPPVSAGGLPIFRHELEHSEMWVATDAGEVVGFGATVVRGGRAFLAELFVRGDRRSHGIGRGLLARCFDARGLPRMTLSSSDPRALALYVGSGLDPMWPIFYLVSVSPRWGETAAKRRERGSESATLESIVALDAKISGRHRPQDFEYWRRDGEARFLRFERGYAVVRHRSDDWVGHEDAITIGPVGGETPDDSAEALLGAVESIRGSGKTLRIGLLGPHPALRGLLARGLEIAELDTFLAEPGALAFDPTCYVPSGGALF